MTERERMTELLAIAIARAEEPGGAPDLDAIAGGDRDLAVRLAELLAAYARVDMALAEPAEEEGPHEALPTFEGFRTVERLGRGGGGEVYKLLDLQLGRAVAAKVVRAGGPLAATLDDFLHEARSLALFDDPRIARIYEFRKNADPPVLLMEYVDGFPLDEIAPSLEFPQRARLMLEICEAIDRAHGLGIQHRDLKPANLLVDARLVPRVLDFGLSRGEPDLGHGVGTPAFMAPELLDPTRPPIDARADVYALGVILYEALCGARPFEGATTDALLAAIGRGEPRLPVEVEPSVPEPLQAIALKAMERDPGQRYPSAGEMARDLRRYLEGRPVLARPSLYQSVLGRRIGPHLAQVREWLGLKLIHAHEADRLVRVYRDLELHDDDWVLSGRALTLPQISLYLGAFLLFCGGLLYLTAYVNDAVEGVASPLLFLGIPFAGLGLGGFRLRRSGRPAVAVAFFLASVALLPLLLLVLLQEGRVLPLVPEDPTQLLGWLGESAPSNAQLQAAALAAAGWSCAVALATRTRTLASASALFALLFHLAVLGDFGLRAAMEEGRWDLVAFRLLPALLGCGVLGRAAERSGRAWFAGPLYITAAFLTIAALELLTLDGRAFAHLGLSTAPFQGEAVTNPTLLDTLAAMSVAGVAFYAIAWLLERHGTVGMRSAAWLLFTLAPFAALEPIAWLNHTGEYSTRYAWLYLVLALAVTLLSRVRQRRSFYYAGVVNTGAALWFVTDLESWWDRPAWAVAVLAAGIAVLAAGYGLHLRERRAGPPTGRGSAT